MFPDRGSNSSKLFDRALNVMPGGNSRHTVYFPPYPIYAARGEGAWVTDVDGVKRLDFINNYSSLIHGHCHPEVTAAIARQAGLLTAISLPTEAEIELAEIICARMPSVDQIRFANSGTEGVMMAIKTARAYTGRRIIAKIEGAYHGSDDTAAVSTYPHPGRFSPPESGIGIPEPGSAPGSAADVLVLQMNDVEGTRSLLRAHGTELAAVLVDPLVKNLAYQPASIEFLTMLREETKALGALLIFDEVYSLRLGFGGAQELLGIKADITAMGKIIGGGLPVGAVGGSAEIMSAVYDQREGKARVSHGGTYNANPLTMAAGVAAMRLFDRPAFERLNRLGDRLRDGLTAVVEATGADAMVRGAASIAGLFHARGGGQTYRELAKVRMDNPDMSRKAELFFHHMLNNGVLMGGPGFFILSTAHTEADVDHVIEQAGRALELIKAGKA
ncbi:aspartate aminotransferase family protein [Sandaracinobacter neustonicus]|uniref:Aspartate aminotransferase family protein n=1 Tax=Sandaracinobacter neustonicus TaxID=1715348 RepID=A0A501XX72_9SPHN|nr:aspartate aminotransferase family protein [Sandaracinobacter neustonicus]TPE64953.1 aspartate aminotransferase family protein [Sandaracinobacter neustonicus]